MPKYIFVTGGVLSGIGKGIAAASIGALFSAAGKKVFHQKFDGYLNVDPGTLSPYRHGEVFVTDDGAETDLDLGHYERFSDASLTKLSSITSGKLYSEILEKERRGDFLGRDVQVVPHLTDLVKEKIVSAAVDCKCDIMIVEIGGTVGDLENGYLLEAIRQLRTDLGYNNTFFVHLTYIPFLDTSQELKSKPTQSSVRELRSLGIQPDMIMARADKKIPKDILDKIALFCDVKPEMVIPAPTIKSIYQVPINFDKEQVAQKIARHFKMLLPSLDMKDWKSLDKKIQKISKAIPIALVGKYTELNDSYLSVIEATKAAAYKNDVKAEIVAIDSVKLEEKDKKEWDRLKKCRGIIVPGGFGSRGIEGKIAAARYCRENKVPYLGLCLGSQIMAIEFARHVVFKNQSCNSEEFDQSCEYPIVHIMEEQKGVTKKGATMRLGVYPCVLNKESKSYKLYGQKKISERHRHRFEFNNSYREQMEKNGWVIAGTSPDGKLVEIVEIKDHPFMVGSQFHPEFKSRPLRPHPLFLGFIKTATKG